MSDAMDFARDLWRHPERYTEAPYAVGARTYDTWFDALDGGHGDGVGNWWNALVWAECRARAADYLQNPSEDDVPEPFGDGAARWLAVRYRSVSDLLNRAADKSASADDKRLIAEGARGRGLLRRLHWRSPRSISETCNLSRLIQRGIEESVYGPSRGRSETRAASPASRRTP